MAIWFITGSSRGFGAEVAKEAASRGHKVVATARDVRALQPLVDEFGDAILALSLDVSDPAQIAAATDAALDRFGRVDVLLNNAGIGYFAAFEESDEEESRRLMEINVFGLAAMTKALLPSMRTNRSGTILNVSSVGGTRTFPALAWYHASKFAVEGISETLAQEVGPLGIRVVLIEPSGFATDWAGSSAQETRDGQEIFDYDGTAGEFRRGFRANAGKEAGDPKRAAIAIVDVAEDGHPPMRLPLGNYAYDGLLDKLDMVRVDISAREQVSRGADYDGRS